MDSDSQIIRSEISHSPNETEMETEPIAIDIPVELNFFDNNAEFNNKIEESKDWNVFNTFFTEESSKKAEFTDFQEFYNSETSTKWNFNDMYVRSNSPVASNCNSDVDVENQEPDLTSEEFEWSNMPEKQIYRRNIISRRNNRIVQTHKNISEDDQDQDHDHNHDNYENRLVLTTGKPPSTYGTKYKKFTYANIENSLSQYYHKTENNFNEMELILTYLNGMRLIYIFSRNITQHKYYYIIMSAIAINIYLTVIAQFIKDSYFGPYVISSGNAIATILISFSYFLKLDSNSAQYTFITNQFNKLETRAEFQNAMDNPFSQKITDLEPNIMEMREYIHGLIPDEAAKLFPLIYRANIMQFIHKTELYRKNLIIRFRDIKNEIHYILHKWNMIGEEFDKIDANHKSKSPHKEKERNRILYLMNLKEQTKNELIQCKYIYSQLDELFKKEIQYAKTHQSCFGCGGAFKPDYDVSKLNTVVRDYLKLILPE